ncbi:DUF2971 domain-containing protein [Heyndrickxia coagulans]|uniref:DUF2971 domain-containing protein n=1 Tax=Heyndrickxia coagulans TaxID=1398 RepID=UPI000E4B7D51|nr:DUF2971 domain-containing protein [Heyndrickxia coagulans]RGR95820.1 DUF2971 domain-containing protein [Heyndrickxia coagulans]
MEPLYLYHYTSIETLALILKNKTIRFSSLSRVDDVEEQKTADFGDLGRFCFVSCWTNDSEESIPLWNLYTPNMTGVRIRLPLDPFEKIQVNPDEKYVKESYLTHPQLTNEKLYELGCSVNPPYIATLCKVQYTDDREKLERKVYSEIHIEPNAKNGFKSSIERKVNIEDIGKYKSKKWVFQNEYRYKFIIVPWSLNEMENITQEEHQKIFDRLKTNKLSFEYIDLELDNKKMKDMEITIGPRANQAQIQIIHSLVNQLNPTASIRESNLNVSM